MTPSRSKTLCMRLVDTTDGSVLHEVTRDRDDSAGWVADGVTHRAIIAARGTAAMLAVEVREPPKKRLTNWYPFHPDGYPLRRITLEDVLIPGWGGTPLPETTYMGEEHGEAMGWVHAAFDPEPR